MKRADKIVLIVADSQPTSMLGCYGNDNMRTPNIDRFSRQGVRFDKAYACQPGAAAARAAILSGMAPHANGVWADISPISEGVKTLGQRMSDNGFDCAFVGKWQLDGGDYFGSGRCPEGWNPDYWYDMRSYLEELSPKERTFVRTPSAAGAPEELCYSHRCTDKAIQFLSKNYDEKFLLVLSFDEPGYPNLCPPKFTEWYKDLTSPDFKADSLQGKPACQKSWAEASKGQTASAATFGCNSFLDYEAGRFLQALDKLAPDALVIYVSTCGSMLGAHGLQGCGPAMYEELVKIPLIVRWNGFVPEGAVCRHPASHLDIAPTILEAASAQPPKIFDGKSLYIALKEPEVKTNSEVFMEYGRLCANLDGAGGFQPIRAVCDGRYKLVVNLLGEDELYDLESDPAEVVNKISASDTASVRDALHDKLLNWMAETRDPFRGPCWESRPWRVGAKTTPWNSTKVRMRSDEDYEPRRIDYATGLEIADSKKA